MVTKPKTKAVVEEVEESKDVQAELISEPSQVQVIDIKHVFRVVSSSGEFSQEEGQNIHPANVIEDYLNQSYFSQGYILFSIEHLKTAFDKSGVTAIGEHMLYILVKYAQ